MATATISIQVDEEVAKAYAEMSPQEQYLLRLCLQDLTLSPRRSLKAVMDEIGQQAQARGLTPETPGVFIGGCVIRAVFDRCF